MDSPHEDGAIDLSPKDSLLDIKGIYGDQRGTRKACARREGRSKIATTVKSVRGQRSNCRLD